MHNLSILKKYIRLIVEDQSTKKSNDPDIMFAPASVKPANATAATKKDDASAGQKSGTAGSKSIERKKLEAVNFSDDPIDWVKAAVRSPRLFDDGQEVSTSGLEFSAMSSVAREFGLTDLGRGSSRNAFELDSKRALKLAINDAGVSQNSNEATLSHDKQYASILPRVLDFDKHGEGFRWIVVEKADETFKTKQQFVKFTGVSWASFMLAMFENEEFAKEVAKEERKEADPKSFSDETSEEIPEATPELKEVAKSIMKMAENNPEMAQMDFMKPDSYGRIGSRIVVVDYGISRNTYSSLYTQGRFDPMKAARAAAERKKK